jgi:hypothetical protein
VYLKQVKNGKNNLSSIKIGDNLSCSINLSSREYNGKWYHNIDGWTCAIANANLDNNEDLPF